MLEVALLLQHLQNYLDTCQELRDSEGVGKACEAIAKAHDRCVVHVVTHIHVYV